MTDSNEERNVVDTFIKSNKEKWVGYERPAVNWYSDDNGKPTLKMRRFMEKHGPIFDKATKGIPHVLTRGGVATCYDEDLYKGFIATLLWNIRWVENYERLIPAFTESPEEIRRKMERLLKKLRRDEEDEDSLDSIYNKANQPSELQLAKGVGPVMFSSILDFLYRGIHRIDDYPIQITETAKNFFYAYLLECQAWGAVKLEGNKILLRDGCSESKMYKKYCRCMYADFTEWISYNGEATAEAKTIIEEAIRIAKKEKEERDKKPIIIDGGAGPQGWPIPMDSTLEDFLSDPYHDYGKSSDDFDIAEWAVGDFAYNIRDPYINNKYDDVDEQFNQTANKLYHLIEDNDLVHKRVNYANYDTGNKGCNIDDPFILSGNGISMQYAYAIAEYLLHWSSPKDKKAELTGEVVKVRNHRRINKLSYIVQTDEGEHQEDYYFIIKHPKGVKNR